MKISIKSKKSKVLLAIISVLVILFLWWSFWVVNNVIFNKDQFASKVYVNNEATNANNIDKYISEKQNYINSQKIVITIDGRDTTYTAKQLGIKLDSNKIKELANKSKLKALLIPFPVKQNYSTDLVVNDPDIAAVCEQLTYNNPDKPINAKFVLNPTDNTISIEDGKKGNGVSYQETKKIILQNINGWSLPQKIESKIQPIEPRVTKNNLQELLPDINNISDNTYSLDDNGKIIELDKTKIIAFYEPAYENGKNILIANKIIASTYLSEVLDKLYTPPKDFITYTYKSGRPNTTSGAGVNGSKVSNTSVLNEDFYSALSQKTSFSGKIIREPIAFKSSTQTIDDTLIKRTFTYSVITWGTVYADFNEFKRLVAETYNDRQGWLKANVAFRQVESGGDFTLVLAEPATLPANFPSTCDATYSCQVGRYVMINDDRWRNATSVWTGTLRDYRHMVTNHETGHWLGQPHQYCQGAGQLAPVMQQQSINLQGCSFNPWPLDWEAQRVSSRY